MAADGVGGCLRGTVGLLGGLKCPHWDCCCNGVAGAGGTLAAHCEGLMRCTGVGRPVESTDGGLASVRERAEKDSAAATLGAASSIMSCSCSSRTIGARSEISETSVGPPRRSETSSCSIVPSMVSTKWPSASPLCGGCCRPQRCPPLAP